MKRIYFSNTNGMRWMKRTASLLMIAFFLSGFTACNDILDEPAENRTFIEETDYTIASDIIKPMLGVYAKFYDMGWECIPLIAVRGDDVNSGGKGDQPDYGETDLFRYNKDFWMYNSLWESMYKKVFYTYSAIEEINKYKEAGAGAALAAQYEAEAKVIRGFLIFQTSRVWGALPIPVDSDPTKLFTVDLTSKDDIMQSISDMMDEAIPALPDAHPKERTDIPGGVTKYTALAIKALANLELKKYDAVASATGEIIKSGKYTLEPDYYELFKVKKGKLNRENLLELQYSDLGASTGGTSYLFGFFGPTSWTPKVTGAGAGWGFYEPSLKYIKFMIDRNEETRLKSDVLFTPDGIALIKEDPKYAVLPDWISNTTPSGDVINNSPRALFFSGKHYLPSEQLTTGRTDYGRNKNYTCIRYAEILLMYAEALTQGASGSAGTADQAINLIRTRVGMPALTGVTNAQVMDEKLAELAFEFGTRYYDMIRLQKYNELSYDGRTFDPSLTFLPYPQTQVDLMPVLNTK